MIQTLLLLISLCTAAVSAQDIGDRVAHTFLKFDALPLNSDDATASGWKPYGDCMDGLGIPFVDQGNTPSTSYPVIAYYTAAGQMAGVGVRVFADDLPATLVGTWYKPADDGNGYEVSVTFRDPAIVCDASQSAPETVGDRLVINQDTAALTIPVSETDAINAGFTAGGCIGGMGTHYSYDLATSPALSYNMSTLVPVTPMFYNGAISAFLISSPSVQEIIPVIGAWEGPFLNAVWCYNWCDSSCSSNFGDSGTSVWSSMHFLLLDHSTLSCPAGHCASETPAQSAAAAAAIASMHSM